MAYYDFCSNCGKDMPYKSKINQRFCTDKCKVDFFNSRRKIERALNRAVEAVQQLNDMCKNDSEITMLALKAIDDIHAVSLNPQKKRHWICNHCGQRRFFDNPHSSPCPFCTNTDWSVVIVPDHEGASSHR